MASEPTAPKLQVYDAKGGVARRRWVSQWYDARGGRHTKVLGWESDTTEKQARRRFDAWKLKWASRRHVRDPAGEGAYRIVSLAGGYLRHASRAYRKDGKPTSHVLNVKYTMRCLRDALGLRPADSAEAPQIAALRDGPLLWSGTGDERRARSMKTVNTRLRILKDAFVWAREKGKISKETLSDVLSVKRLRKGRSDAIDPVKIVGVSDELVATTMVHAPRVLSDMVELQRLTGMRPGEVCSMRGSEIEAGGEVWIYKPRHKLEHMENVDRVVCLGPRAQKLLKPYLRTDLSAYLFSPAEAHGQRIELRRAERRHQREQLQAQGQVLKPQRKIVPIGPSSRLRPRYTTESYRKAIHWACRKAGVEGWAPNQIRHAAATRLEKKYGLDGSRVVLGHGSAKTTLIYLDPDVKKAMQIAREVG